jgi:MFS transporter, DHA1 family, inner membrane transport protein
MCNMNIKKERLLLISLAAIQFTNIVDFMIMMPMGDILKKTLLITPSQYGALVSSYGIAAFLSSFAGVFYLDKLDRRKALLVAYIGFILGTMSSAIVPNTSNLALNYYLFIGTRVLTGISGGLMGGLVLAIIGDVVPLERRGRAMAVITIAFSLASIIGVPIALTLVDAFDGNWHIPFYGVSLLALPFWFMAYKYVPAINAHLKGGQKRNSFDTIRRAFNTREQRNGLMFTFLLILGQFTVVSFLTPYLVNNVGIRQQDIKWIYLVGGACTVISGRFIGGWVDKIGRFRIFSIFALLSIIPVYINTNLPPVSLWVVLVIAGLFFIFISGRMIPANTIATSLVKPEHRGGYMSLNSATMSLASGSSAIIAGAIVSQTNENSPIEHYEWVGYVAIASTLLSLLVVRILRKIDNERKAQAQ